MVLLIGRGFPGCCFWLACLDLFVLVCDLTCVL